MCLDFHPWMYSEILQICRAKLSRVFKMQCRAQPQKSRACTNLFQHVPVSDDQDQAQDQTVSRLASIAITNKILIQLLIMIIIFASIINHNKASRDVSCAWQGQHLTPRYESGYLVVIYPSRGSWQLLPSRRGSYRHLGTISTRASIEWKKKAYHHGW